MSPGRCCRRWENFCPIWTSRILSNGGELHRALERALCECLGVPHLALLTNGTTALITALQTLRITGEVITLPYSFVATAHSLLWKSITPIFVDIDPVTLNMDPSKIEAPSLRIPPPSCRRIVTARRATPLRSRVSPLSTTSR